MSSQYPYITGWADYADDFYDGSTATKTFSMLADTDYILPNNGQGGNLTQLPNGGITSMYTPMTLPYDTETGTFTEGLVVTGGTSGATGLITHIQDDGTTGSLYIAEVSGTFVDNEAITDTSTGAALVNGALEFGGIEGRNGDAILYTIEFTATPTEVGTTYMESWVDIGGAVGELYRRIITFPKGNGVERQVTFTTLAYTLGTFEANKGIIHVTSNGTADIQDIRVVTSPIHRAR